MVGLHHQFSGHQSEQTPGDDGQGGLANCSPRGCRQSEATTTQQKPEDLSWPSLQSHPGLYYNIRWLKSITVSVQIQGEELPKELNIKKHSSQERKECLWRTRATPACPLPSCSTSPIAVSTLTTLAFPQVLVLTILYPAKGFCT